jgi:hypothetical protein
MLLSRWTRSVISMAAACLMFVAVDGAQLWDTQLQASQLRAPTNAPYERGFREGALRGEQDARQGRAFSPEGHSGNRRGDVFSDSRSRNPYLNAVRRGYVEGYRAGYGAWQGGNRRETGPRFGQAPRGARQEPASARGYSDGFKRGFDDGRSGDRYDAVRSREYRDGDAGYYGAYGSRDAYRNNYRAGFRQGYEDGYRDGTGSGRR